MEMRKIKNTSPTPSSWHKTDSPNQTSISQYLVLFEFLLYFHWLGVPYLCHQVVALKNTEEQRLGVRNNAKVTGWCNR